METVDPKVVTVLTDVNVVRRVDHEVMMRRSSLQQNGTRTVSGRHDNEPRELAGHLQVSSTVTWTIEYCADEKYRPRILSDNITDNIVWSGHLRLMSLNRIVIDTRYATVV